MLTWSVGHELESIFQRKFSGLPALANVIASRACSNLPPTNNPANTDRINYNNFVFTYPDIDSPASNISSDLVGYEHLFAGIYYGLVELISTLFGSLGCMSPRRSSTRYLEMRLFTDQTRDMFGSCLQPFSSSMPMSNADDENYVRQMIEIWFIHHPLSVLVSKTVLLHQLRNRTVDPALLAVILADAHVVRGGPHIETGQMLFAWATESVRNRPLDTISLSTIQTAIFLGWYMACSASLRRAYCFFQLARVAAFEMQDHVQTSEYTLSDDHINGVSLARVELELVQRIYWFTFSLDLWAALQLDIPFCGAMTWDTSIGVFPLDTSESAIFSLDRASGNVATLKIQKRLVQQLLWPLSHITSTIASVYALYPHNLPNETESAAADDAELESSTLIRLRRLLNCRGDLSAICSDVYHTLSESLAKLESKPSFHPSHLLTTAAYRIILIHFLFPHSGPSDIYSGLTPSTLKIILESISQFQKLMCHTECLPPAETESVDDSKDMISEIFVMGIDTCGRALNYIFNFWSLGFLGFEPTIICHGELVELSSSLYQTCKHPKLRGVANARSVKKRLKMVCTSFASLYTPATSEQNSSNDRVWQANFHTLAGNPVGIDSEQETNDYFENVRLDMNIDWVNLLPRGHLSAS